MQKKNDDVYRELQEHLDNMPVGLPATESGIEIKLLKQLFTPEQAQISLKLKFVGDPLKKIYRKLKKSGFSLEELEKKLDEMYFKGLVHRAVLNEGESEIKYYASAPFVVGMYEFQLDQITPEFYRDSEEYLNEHYIRKEYNKSGIPQMRVVPLDQTVSHEQSIANYDDIKQLIENIGEPIAVMDCICRKGTDLIGEPCKKTKLRETCLTFRMGAKIFLEKGLAREITKEEAFKILEEAKEDGLVLQPGNSQRPINICICCGCCCGLLKGQKMLPGISQLFATNYYAEADPSVCEGCGICEDRCNLDAVRVEDNIARVDRETCIGCGVCVPTCTSEAMKLFKKEEITRPPKNTFSTYAKIMVKKAELARAEKTQT